jgi:hypothetical protein
LTARAPGWTARASDGFRNDDGHRDSPAGTAPQEPWVVPIARPCQRCGHEVGRIGPGKGPHAAVLLCDRCGRFLMWVARRVLEILRQQRTAGGELAP